MEYITLSSVTYDIPIIGRQELNEYRKKKLC